MDYQTFHLRTAADSGAFLEINPGREFNETWETGRGDTVSLGGRRFTHVPAGAALRHTVPLAFVSSADRETIDGWWRDQPELVFTFNLSESTAQSVRVQMINEREPLGLYIPATRELYAGVLFLRVVVANGKLGGGPFILDDAVWGKLDETYNVLL